MKQFYQHIFLIGMVFSTTASASPDYAIQQDPLLMVDQPIPQYARTLAQDEKGSESTAVQQDPLLVLPSTATTKSTGRLPAIPPRSRREIRLPATRSSSVQEDPLMQNLPTP